MVLAAVSNTLRYDPSLCINCGLCSIVCPHAVFGPGEREAQWVDPEACMECGACQRNCPTAAITVDSGVGCAAALIRAALAGRKEATYGGNGDTTCAGSEPPATASTCQGGGEPAESGREDGCQ